MRFDALSSQTVGSVLQHMADLPKGICEVGLIGKVFLEEVFQDVSSFFGVRSKKLWRGRCLCESGLDLVQDIQPASVAG